MNIKTKLTEVEKRLNFMGEKPYYCVIFQDGKTIPDDADQYKTKIVAKVNLNQNDI